MDDLGTLGAIALDWMQADTRARIFVDADLRVLWRNRQAEELLARSAVASLSQGRLSFRVQSQDKMMRERLSAVGEALSTWAVPCPDRRSNLLFRARCFHGGRICCLEICLDDASFRPRLTDYDTIFGLTKSEARTAQALFEGNTVSEIARSNAVSIQTVRTHVRQLYTKLGIATREKFFRRLQPFQII